MFNNRINVQPDFIFSIFRVPQTWKPEAVYDVPPSGTIISQTPVASFDEAHDDMMRCYEFGNEKRPARVGCYSNGRGRNVIAGFSSSPAKAKSKSTATRSLYLAGLLLLASGLFHIFVWLLLGGDWNGPVSWRKPILFGISTGATLLSIAWFFNKLRPTNWDIGLCRLLSFTLVLEVALITLQQWRGKASHFNHDSTFDSIVEYLMTALIVVATLVLCQITWRTFSFLDGKEDLQLAIRGGMTFLMLSCLIGFWVLFNGQYQLSSGRDPSTFGEAGVTKFPHGVAIHAIQLFPILCWIFQILGVSLTQRVRLIRFSVGALGGLLTFSLVQTLLGKPRFELSTIGVTILAISILLFAPVIWAVFGAIRSRLVAAIATPK